jgi:hypothetical protein
MTKKELNELVRRNLRNSPMIDTETGLKAIEAVAEFAAEKQIQWALAGGLAMHIYGSPRLTKDADVIASATLSIKSQRRLGFGGDRYIVQVGEKEVPVDWIVRNDEARPFYQAALAAADEVEGIKILTPEWLVITKYIAGRYKDQEDAVFLLKQPKLVDRKKIKGHYLKLGGSLLWAAVSAGYFRWFDLADGKVFEGDENESYRKL